MTIEIDPVIGNWYKPLDKRQMFMITAINENDDTIEIQFFDGDIEEISMSDWYEQDLETCEEPESWSGAVDIAEVDDFGTDITDTKEEDWTET